MSRKKEETFCLLVQGIGVTGNYIGVLQREASGPVLGVNPEHPRILVSKKMTQEIL